LRAVSEHSRRRAREGIVQVATKIAEAHDARAEVTMTAGYDVTVNDGRMVDLAAASARELFGERGFITMQTPVMGGEDWCYVLQRIPGCMVFLGVVPEGGDHRHAAPCHSNKMMMDEDAMAHGVALYAAVAERFLEQGLPAN
jgi:hippurate hydrolase